ncbi:MAG: phosphatidate cytidylyltransferase [Lachnospiraceae bacterium]|nr:phosphatidate cytidylyltransferase [Lachnospiraceae bacterium]
MRTRIISGAVITAIVAALLFLPAAAVFVFAFAISILTAYELFRCIKAETDLIGFAGYAAILIYYLCMLSGKVSMLAAVAICFILIMAVYVFTYPKYKINKVSFIIFGFIYTGVLVSFLYCIRQLPYGQYFMPLVFIGAWVNDVGAYFVGVKFGKHHFAPVLSPHKSLEGLFGGLAFSALVGALYGFIVNIINKDFGTHVLLFAGISLVSAAVSVLGDLSASAIKRDRGLKDYGNIIPGHGGILDRCDSLFYAAPVVYLMITLLWK